MKRTTIMADEVTLERLRSAAADRGVSIAEIIREAIDEKLAGYQPRPRSGGAGTSGHSDTARRAGDERPEPRAWR
jgi:hypothetical protein